MKIIKTFLYIKISSKIFIGNCVSGLDDDYFRDRVADDATRLAQLVENGQKISEQQFFNIVGPEYKKIKIGSNYSYYYNPDMDIAWFYDEDTDIEYFYI